MPSTDGLVETITATALQGLSRDYRHCPQEFHHTVRHDPQGRPRPYGYNLRYGAISQIGVSRWRAAHPAEPMPLPDLWQKAVARLGTIDDLGDAALWVWAWGEGGQDGADLFIDRLIRLWRSQRQRCNAVEFAWVLLACLAVHERSPAHRARIEGVMREADAQLRPLFCASSRLVCRHAREGWIEGLGRRIACFADQVYPILAYSRYGTVFEDRQALDLAGRVVETLCQLQGPLGQWWWHYNTQTGRISEEYPVFSVHQEAMAPMALLAYDRATGQNHRALIDRGLAWLTGKNELQEDLVHPEEGIIWRDIEKREPYKASRIIRALSSAAGLTTLHRLTDKCCLGLRVNRECRPYELGWILYAWADSQSPRRPRASQEPEAAYKETDVGHVRTEIRAVTLRTREFYDDALGTNHPAGDHLAQDADGRRGRGL